MNNSKEKSGTIKKDEGNQSENARITEMGIPEEHILKDTKSERQRAKASGSTVGTQGGKVAEESDVQERWEEIKAEFRSRHEELTDDDVVYQKDRPGSFGEMLGRIEKRIGRNREQLRYDIDQWNPTDTRNK